MSARTFASRHYLIAVLCSAWFVGTAIAQEQEEDKPIRRRAPKSITLKAEADTPATDDAGASQNAGQEAKDTDRYERFAKYMTGAKFVGRFTVLGKDDKELPQEEYTIAKCEKLPKGNLFRFTARIQYGDTDTEVPMDLPVEWAGDTPVISLTNLWIPGLGTFSSRVVVYQGSYAGTWTHGDKGGHLFGTIEKEESAEEAESAAAAEESEPAGANTVEPKSLEAPGPAGD